MRLRSHRRNLVIWSSSVDPADRYGSAKHRAFTRTGRIRRWVRIGAVLTVILIRPRWRPLLAGAVLTVVGFLEHGGEIGIVLIPGFLLLSYALLVPIDSDEVRKRRSQLERELAAYSTPAQRWDLEATLDQYPDDITYEIREILTNQTMAAHNNGIPGAK